MNLKESFRVWLESVQENLQRRNFNEIQEELNSEIVFAQMNGFDPIEWCQACRIGICEIHLEFSIFTPDDSFGVEK